jgi:hypothetical protein
VLGERHLQRPTCMPPVTVAPPLDTDTPPSTVVRPLPSTSNSRDPPALMSMSRNAFAAIHARTT